MVMNATSYIALLTMPFIIAVHQFNLLKLVECLGQRVNPSTVDLIIEHNFRE